MSRIPQELSPFVTITTGSDHATGRFVQVQDDRYARSGADQQGEGYVMDWDQLSGFSTNLINASVGLIYHEKSLVELCDKFCEQNGYK